MMLRKPREEFTKHEKLTVGERENWHCQICRRDIRSPSERKVIDHILPLALGGESVLTNAQLLCGWCDDAKTSGDISDVSKADETAAKHFLGRKKSRAWGFRR